MIHSSGRPERSAAQRSYLCSSGGEGDGGVGTVPLRPSWIPIEIEGGLIWSGAMGRGVAIEFILPEGDEPQKGLEDH